LHFFLIYISNNSKLMMIEVFTDTYFMKQALLEAKKAFLKGEIPVGAIVVCNNQIIARTHNNTEQLGDVTAHAEIIALTASAAYLGSKYLTDCTMYVTLEPCAMCAGALAWAQLDKLVYGTSDEKRGFMRFGKKILHPKTKVEFGFMAEECERLLKEFFQKVR